MGGADVCGEWWVWEYVEVVWCVCGGGVGWGRVGCVSVGGLFKNTRKTDTDIKKKRHTDVDDLSLTAPPIPARKQAQPASTTSKQAAA